MRNTVKILFVCVLTAFILCVSVSALQGDSFSWYCKRNTNHAQPEIDAEMRFIEEYGGFYVDKKHPEEKRVYLTFDAGYENGNVEKIVNILNDEGVKGSFFILENLLIKNGDLVQEMVDNGNLVCNHTANHKDVSKMSFEEMKTELEIMETLYKEQTGREMPKYFRPPEGRFSKESMQNAEKLGYKTVFWSFAYADWDNNAQMSPEKALEKIMSNVHNGAILLLHPTSSTNVSVLPEVIKQLKAQGYSFRTVDGL